jgi:hypothetical protein
MRIAKILWIGLLLLLLATVAFAQPAVPSAPVCRPSIDGPQVVAPPAPELKSWTGQAYYDSSLNPNCTWTCSSGSSGAQNVSSELACRKACNTSCGPFCLML